jgi:excinuclease UvrABC nuclease subunit
MAEENGNSAESPRRLSLSENRVKEIVENAILSLQLALVQTYAPRTELDRVVKEQADVAAALKVRIEEVDSHFADVEGKVESLQQDKAGREAVSSYKRFVIGGGILTTFIAATQLAVTLWVVKSGG